MEKKSQFLVGVAFFSMLMVMSMVAGTVTINTPTSGLAVNGSYNFSVTTTGSEYLNCSFATTGDGRFAEVANTSVNQTSWSIANDTALLTEALATTFTVNCTNDSTSVTATQTFDVDNTAPTCSFSMPVGEETIDYMDGFGVYPTDASSDTTTLTWAWVLYDANQNVQATSTEQKPNFCCEDFDEITDFTLTLNVTDEVGKSTRCTNKTLSVEGTDGDIVTTTTTKKISDKSRTTMIIGIIVSVFILAMIAVLFFLIKKSKK